MKSVVDKLEEQLDFRLQTGKPMTNVYLRREDAAELLTIIRRLELELAAAKREINK